MRDEGETPPGNGKQWRAAGLAAGLGCSIVTGLIVCILGGVLLDRWLDTTPIFTLVGVFLGILVAASQLYRLARAGR